MFLELGLPFVCRLLKPDHQENLERTRAGTSWNANWNELERTRAGSVLIKSRAGSCRERKHKRVGVEVARADCYRVSDVAVGIAR
ncbi:hypothetical protein F2Q68_00003359 [Brassica cretica]|uniref:Uncharacterized protein n=1 Tax=Brassica cretica TaxID=69181 RepID=A0A8S9JJ70_BRACR|nr:hypothetical protein F2Q68_00003359 [Brassica cretica]